MTWQLTVPFEALDLKLPGEATLEALGHSIAVLAGPAPRFAAKVENLQSESEARRVLKGVKTGLLVAGIYTSTGVRLLDEGRVTVVTESKNFFEGPPAAVISPQESENIRFELAFGRPQLQDSWTLFRDGLQDGAKVSSKKTALNDKKVRLACEIYLGSFFEASLGATFLTLMTVLEVLKDEDPRSPDAVAMIEGWARQIETLDSFDRNSMRTSLKFMQSISISQGIDKVVSRHLGKEKGKEAKDLYGLRSTLVHDGKIGISDEEFERKISQARTLTLKLIRAILSRGGI